METKNEQNEFEKLNSLYLESSAFQEREDMIINDPEIGNIPVNQHEIVNPDKTETVKEGANYRHE